MLQFIVPMEPLFGLPALMRRLRLGQFDLHVAHVEIFAGQFRDDTENQAVKIKDLLTLETTIVGVNFIGALIALGLAYYFLR